MKACFLLLSLLVAGPVLGDMGASPTALAPNYDLRVYGKLTAEDKTPPNADYHLIRITTESPTKAELLLSKFLRDFTTLPPVIFQQVSIGDKTIPGLAFEGGRRIVPVWRAGQSTVDFYLFATQMDLTRVVAATPEAFAGATAVEGRKYPYFFDFWDRHAMGSWYAPRLGWDGPWFTESGSLAFMRRYGLNMNMGGDFHTGAAESDRYGIGYKFNRWLDVSTSSYDANPEAATTGDPDLSFLNPYYGDVPFADNPVGFGQMDEMTAFYKQFSDDEFLTTFTDPHGETGPGMETYIGGNQRDEFSRRDLVHFLRDINKLSLSDLGTRWYGQADKYKSWDEVNFPREREYYGWDDGHSQDLGGTWKLNGGSVSDGETAGYNQPTYDDSKWFTFQQPGTTYIDVTHRPGNPGGWNRFTFTADDTLLKSGKTIYLTVCPFNDARWDHPDVVYLNGKKMGEVTFGFGLEWAQFDVTSVLKPGANLFALHTQYGLSRGPVFLTLKKAENYPTSDVTLNARWFDTREWAASDVARGNMRDITYLRSADPDRVVKVMAADSMTDFMNPYLQALGAVPHSTGESAFFVPWSKRYGYLRGINESSEPSQPAKNIDELKSLFFCMTMEGMNDHDYFINLTNLLLDPVQQAWYEKNLPYLELMGVFNLKRPEIVIARSPRVLRTFPFNVAEENDIGRGDIVQSHYGYVYTTERDIADRLIDNYKILIDDNFHALMPEDVDHLQAWVEQGGTLVLNQRSGRDSYLQGNNTWPIAKLLGGTPTVRPQTGTIKFEDHPVILGAYAGKTFNNYGESVDWQKYNYFGDSIALAEGPDVAVVARYDDGKPAIIVRTVGKGRVVVLGSAFYRKTSDVHGYYVGSPDDIAFYDHLFADLGVAPLVESSNDKLWAERFISNNGSTEMLILGNQDGTTPLQGASATWDLGFHPTRVFDPANGSDIKVKVDGNKVTIDNLDLAPHDLRYYAVERSDLSTDETLKHWLARQSELWHALTIPAATPPVEPLHAITFPGLFAVKQFTDEAEARQALAPDAEVDKTWRQMRQSDWEAAGLSMGPKIVTVYRKTFTATPEWLKGLRGVQVMSGFGDPKGPMEMAINGTKISGGGTPAATPEQVLATLKPGNNLLTVLAKSGGDGNGGFSNVYALRRLPAGDIVDISNDWTGWLGDANSATVNFPAKGDWTMVRKTVTLTDAQRAAGSIWLEVESGLGAVSVNGHVLYNSNPSQYSPGAPYRVNITADFKKDGPNEIGIGAGNWLNGQFLPAHLEIGTIKLVLVPKT